MSNSKKRLRGEAYAGRGYGTLRFHLFVSARHHIESSIRGGYYCEAIAIIESVITDRLESRLSWLMGGNQGFITLGSSLQQLRDIESDSVVRQLLLDVDVWRSQRNKAIHELVKVEQDQPLTSWSERRESVAMTARAGYDLLKKIYHRLADLNPNHADRAFPKPYDQSSGSNDNEGVLAA